MKGTSGFGLYRYTRRESKSLENPNQSIAVRIGNRPRFAGRSYEQVDTISDETRLSESKVAKSPRRIAHLDGLRGLALIGALLSHFRHGSDGAFLGVDIFFVLSGFLITRSVFNQLSRRRFSLTSFLWRRFWRLCPALLCTILVTILCENAFFSTGLIRELTASLDVSTLAIMDSLLAPKESVVGTYSSIEPLLDAWSLSMELRLYILWPVVLMLSSQFFEKGRMSLPLTVFSSTAMIYGVVAATHGLQTELLILPSRAIAYQLGAILATAPSVTGRKLGNIISIGGSAMILLSFALLSSSRDTPALVAITAHFGSLLVISSPSSDMSNKIYGYGLLNYLGKISYAAYLVHWPMVVAYHSTYEDSSANILVKFTFGISMMVAASLLYHCVEDEFRKGKRLWHKFAGLCLLMSVIVASVHLSITHGREIRSVVVSSLKASSELQALQEVQENASIESGTSQFEIHSFKSPQGSLDSMTKTREGVDSQKMRRSLPYGKIPTGVGRRVRSGNFTNRQDFVFLTAANKKKSLNSRRRVRRRAIDPDGRRGKWMDNGSFASPPRARPQKVLYTRRRISRGTVHHAGAREKSVDKQGITPSSHADAENLIHIRERVEGATPLHRTTVPEAKKRYRNFDPSPTVNGDTEDLRWNYSAVLDPKTSRQYFMFAARDEVASFKPLCLNSKTQKVVLLDEQRVCGGFNHTDDWFSKNCDIIERSLFAEGNLDLDPLDGRTPQAWLNEQEEEKNVQWVDGLTVLQLYDRGCGNIAHFVGRATMLQHVLDNINIYSRPPHQIENVVILPTYHIMKRFLFPHNYAHWHKGFLQAILAPSEYVIGTLGSFLTRISKEEYRGTPRTHLLHNFSLTGSSKPDGTVICFREAVVPGFFKGRYFASDREYPSRPAGSPQPRPGTEPEVPQDAARMREMVHAFIHNSSAPPAIQKRVVFLDRGGKRRAIPAMQKQQLIRMIKDAAESRLFTFEVVSFDSMVFEEQVKIIETVSIAIGVHGANLVNTMFMVSLPLSLRHDRFVAPGGERF